MAGVWTLKCYSSRPYFVCVEEQCPGGKLREVPRTDREERFEG
jgi:hypothetical protein